MTNPHENLIEFAPECRRHKCALKFAEHGPLDDGFTVVHTSEGGETSRLPIPDRVLNDINVDIWSEKVLPWLKEQHRTTPTELDHARTILLTLISIQEQHGFLDVSIAARAREAVESLVKASERVGTPT